MIRPMRDGRSAAAYCASVYDGLLIGARDKRFDMLRDWIEDARLLDPAFAARATALLDACEGTPPSGRDVLIAAIRTWNPLRAYAVAIIKGICREAIDARREIGMQETTTTLLTHCPPVSIPRPWGRWTAEDAGELVRETVNRMFNPPHTPEEAAEHADELERYFAQRTEH